jgi:glycosyltransferase involved in cell wall biosynthesis
MRNDNDHAGVMISIITPCLNRAHFVQDAIQSVMEQNYTDFEHIIIDGGSTDGTLELLSKYPHLKVTSEPDRGMYDALNKGLAKIQGDIVGFLNTDDTYAPDCFREIIRTFEDKSVDAAVGKAIISKGNSEENQPVIMEIAPSNPERLWEKLILGLPAFNAWFFRRETIKTTGVFNSDYRIIADREYLIRFWMHQPRYRILDRVIYNYHQHSESFTINIDNPYRKQIIDEHLKMMDVLLSNPLIPKKAAGLLRQARTRDTLNISTYLLRKKKFADAWKYVQIGVRHDWTWPARIIFRGLKSIASR